MESNSVFLRRIATFLESKLILLILKLLGKDTMKYDYDRLIELSEYFDKKEASE